MKYYVEKELSSFDFWGGAIPNAELLTIEELNELGALMEDFSNEWSNTEINDFMWFQFEDICEMLGLIYDVEADKIIRLE